MAKRGVPLGKHVGLVVSLVWSRRGRRRADLVRAHRKTRRGRGCADEDYRGRRVLVAAVAAAIVVSAIAASTASAVLVRLPNGQTVSYQPLRSAAGQYTRFDNAFGNLDYNGGPVMPSNTDYLVFWSPAGLSAYPSEYPTGLEQYFTNLAHDNGGHQNTDSVSTQYNDADRCRSQYAVTFGGALVDTNPYPKSQCPVSKPVTDA